MRKFITAALVLAASPAFAAEEEAFFSLHNSEFIVSLAFILFIGVLVYFKVPGMIAGMLDKRADTIKTELSDARALREEAQSLLASFERKQKEVQAQADRIVTQAKEEASRAAEQAKEDIRASVGRRLAAAEEQIASAQAAAIRDVRDRAVAVAVAAAAEIIATKMDATGANKLIDDAIAQVETRLN